MWLITDIIQDKSYSFEKVRIRLSVSESETIPIRGSNFRVSKIFKLVETKEHQIPKSKIRFIQANNPHFILGVITNEFKAKYKNNIYFSIGSCSIIIIDELKGQFEKIIEYFSDKILRDEVWNIDKHGMLDIKISNHQELGISSNTLFEGFSDYKNLNLTERAIIDEFVVSVSLLFVKFTKFHNEETQNILKLVSDVDEKVQELLYLREFKGKKPTSLSEYKKKELRDGFKNMILKQQALDRIIQVNSALSYVSTQANSGNIPIHERRSLIRRNSLLGVGIASDALNKIAHFIELAFSLLPLENRLRTNEVESKPLEGIGNLPIYNSSNWNNRSIGRGNGNSNSDQVNFKLTFFSARRGYRETEYSISAALQSLYEGSGLKWSLMTITHEMLHGHVRLLLSCIFYGEEKNSSDKNRVIFYQDFIKKIKRQKLEDENLNDSIRFIILTHCCMTITHGSLTNKVPYNGKFKLIEPKTENELWDIYEDEYRNISEIIVHVLDLHYFYYSRLNVYIPLIWASWVEIPHVNGNLRQYILRSLLAISSKVIHESSILRFKDSVKLFRKIIKKYKNGVLNHPIISKIQLILDDENELKHNYFPAFKSYLIIVDLTKEVFLSRKIRGFLYSDKYISTKKNKKGGEDKFSYDLPIGFSDLEVKSPTAFLLDRMTKIMSNSKSEYKSIDFERLTATYFIIISSSLTKSYE